MRTALFLAASIAASGILAFGDDLSKGVDGDLARRSIRSAPPVWNRRSSSSPSLMRRHHQHMRRVSGIPEHYGDQKDAGNKSSSHDAFKQDDNQDDDDNDDDDDDQDDDDDDDQNDDDDKDEDDDDEDDKSKGTISTNPGQASNIKAMHDFIEHLEKMNADWQQQAQDRLKKGEKPLDFPQFVGSDYHSSKGNYFAGDLAGYANPAASKSKDDCEKGKPNGPPSGLPRPDITEKPAKSGNQDKYPRPQSSQPLPTPDEQKEQREPQWKPKPTSQAQPQPQKQHQPSNYSAGGNDQKWFDGQMTYYDIGPNACGWSDHEPDYIVALSSSLFDSFGSSSNSNNNPVCNRKIFIEKNGKNAVARVTDQCPECSYYDLDMSKALFAHFENMVVGKTSVKWHWVG